MENIIKLYEKSFKEHGDLPALTDYTTGKTYTYRQLAAKVELCHGIFREMGIQTGDKIALVGKNSIDWICTYIGVITYGAVIVPILPDFNPIDMKNIINHSDSRLLFADKVALAKLDTQSLPEIRKTYVIEEMPDADCANFDLDGISYADTDMEDVMIISYTSGTTGNSKGVMLSVRSISANVNFAISRKFFFKGSHVLGLLPLAHAYGCTFDMLTPLTIGSHIFILGRTPSPRIFLEALAKVQPSLICSVPMVMEKLVRKNVMPALEKQPVKLLSKIPLLNRIVYNKIGKQLISAFGGKMIEMNLGGAALAPDVERLLMRARFPFSVGYGMTECAPLISFENWNKFKRGSCGTLLPGMEARIIENGCGKGIGEICIRGVNLMSGYYKNPEATAQAMQDGWFHTGDIGYVTKKNIIYLKGRCKTMILTSAGQNIYPEEIESKLNDIEGVGESLVYEKDGKVHALVVPDAEAVKRNNWDTDTVKAKMKEVLITINTLVAPYEKISEIQLCAEPFEKTPKQSIKRFLYPANAKLME